MSYIYPSQLPTGSAEDDTTYASSEVSAESREEGEDYSSIHGGSSSDIGEAESSPMTDLGNLFAKAEREFSQIESKSLTVFLRMCGLLIRF